MAIKHRWKIVVLALLFMFAILAGGEVYMSSVQNSLWIQSVTDVGEVTAQAGHAFEVYIKKDMEMLDGLALNLSQKKSSDEDAVMNRLHAFGEVNGSYFVINLDKGIFYSSEDYEIGSVTLEQLSRYTEFSDRGIEEPYKSSEAGVTMLGYYENFVFADGIRGLIWKAQELSAIAAEFSLSFYDGKGYSYIVNKQGDVIIGSSVQNGETVSNVFDAIEQEENSKEELKDFQAALAGGESGVARISCDSEEYVYAYVPIETTDGWYLISIIPNSVIMQQADRVMKSSQMFVFTILIAIFIFGVFMLVLRQHRKNVMEKELEIQYREQLFSILANNTEDVFIMFTTSDKKVEYISPNVERVLGILPDEVKADLFVLDENSSDAGRRDFKEISSLEPGSSLTIERERIHKKTGERRWFMETAYRVSIDDADKIIVLLSDRTAEKQKKEALEQALEIAEVANQSKSTFLSNMSHDIRTPMNAIVGLCTLLQRDADNPERVREHTKKITASSRHLLGLINDVLDMSKIESGKTTLNITEINLAEIVDELGTIIRPQAKAKHQTFEISVFDVKTEHLQGDPLRINQILINILSNAVKYTQVGGHVEMVIRQMPQMAKNYANLRFIIKDDGIGMSPKYIETIFHPFTREINSITNKVQGTGLGMAITKNLVDLMGGTISVESAPGKGSTFTVDLELRIQEKEIDQDFWKKHGVTHALIVDDETEVCTSIITAMAGTGVAMQFALDGHSAVQIVDREHRDGRDFDLVLIDWKMPGMDGIETARRIREIIPEDVPIMILTAYDWGEIEEEAIAAGINGFLPKPFFLSNFKQTIEKLKLRIGEGADLKEQASVLAGKHILAAEDNELNSEILAELLGMIGATCDLTENGQQALECFEKSVPGQYDLILLDIQMPVMNGYEAARAIRASKHPLAKSIPIIAMTANAFAEDIKNALDAGMDAHVAKPVDIERIEAVFKDILAKNTYGGNK